MLGCTTKENDVYVFFENDEIERLETERLNGSFVNFSKPDVQSSLDAMLDEKISGRVNNPTASFCLRANPSADGVGHQKKLTNFN